MMRVSVCVVSVVVVAQAMMVAAQARPDFSGEWVLDTARTQAANRKGASGSGGGRMIAVGPGGVAAGGAAAVTAVRITQTADAVTIERLSGQVWEKVVHRLDGVASTNTNGRSTMTLKSRWDGARLISEGQTETRLANDEGTISSTVREIRSIDADGTLVVESTRTVTATGIQVGNNGKPVTSIQYFTKRR